jgi:mannose-1-phosphate guanylyltransferase
VIVVLPVDPYVDDSFFETVKDLETEISRSDKKLALISVTPTYPSEKYGYIVPKTGESAASVRDVDHFTEKPDEKEARQLMKQNALWNCGVFAFRLGFILDIIDELGYSHVYENLRKDYAMLPKISFDYQVVEKTREIITLRYDGKWKDLGTWNTLTEEMHGCIIGKGLISNDSLNTHLVNELDIPVIVMGLSGCIVAASPDGILVADKKATPRLKELVTDFAGRPMFEERRWGWYRVLDYTKLPQNREVLTKRIGIRAGKNLSYQMHYFRSEIWTIVSGSGEYALDGVIYPVKAGDVLHIKNQAKHGIRAITDLEIIEVQMGRELVEEDIVRLFLTWDEIESHCDRHLVAERTSVSSRI